MSKETPVLENFVLIGKFSDGKLYQFVTDDDEKRALLQMLYLMSNSKSIPVLDKPIEGIEITFETKLYGKGHEDSHEEREGKKAQSRDTLQKRAKTKAVPRPRKKEVK